MERHSGHIGVKSQVGVETVFTLYLPASDQEPPATADGIAGTQPRRGKILAMDDEDMIRDLIDHMLRHMGFDVVTASSGEEAIQLYRQGLEDGKPFDLVILDLTVPGAMGGKEALEKLREIDPAVTAIVSSGYSNDPIMADFQSYGFKGVVVKPFSVQNLGDTLSRILT
jgi:CheY-like chemotaxis protein